MTDISPELRDKLDAAAFRRLVSHLQNRPDVQNIELMILADFCRNCLGDWWRAAAQAEGVSLTKDEARERIYGMPYAEWKARCQRQATPEQMAAFEARRKTET
ncbi:DUF1244 domain-containing protein [Amphiplicatus metriothermophilus]|uniref:SMc04008-like domain-containing protein n=1 Tax=Amphiplicatus metriothermophilus TaxID=1519374 RepID=A0A239PKC6_9PROT|nr:DUF1244 domain-containing protein [Amphiplicatus metriothermophilus]MBB5517578.1 hypothetical protein [Amphiplicatus metriothermophilus]SNT68087.1 hypothetical protein SAMN06297382_0583 [Amphiplicatus metriothermophilus]